MTHGFFGRGFTGLVIGALGSLIFINCSSDGPVGAINNNGGSTGSTGVITLDGGGIVTGSGGTTTGTTTPTTTANCGIQSSKMTQQQADLLLVLDASGSMRDDIASSDRCNVGTAGCTQRWATVTSALGTVLASPVAAGIDWGLKFYATNSTCSVSAAMEVNVGPGTSAQIQQQIKNKTPGSNTPTRAAIEAAVAYLKTVSNTHTKSILLATDGEPNCKPGESYTTVDMDGTVQAITAAAKAGFRVYVIGIGPKLDNLQTFAVAGGTGNYYSATSPAALTTALQTVAGQVASCTFTMSAAPPDPSNIGVYLEGKGVPKDASNGWNLAPNNLSVEFTGSYCDGIKAGTYKDVQVYFGCPGVTVPVKIY